MSEVLVPKWGSSMSEATVVRWHVEVGARVREGDPIVDLETDKVEATVDSPYDGVITALCAQPDDVLAVGGVLATIDEE